MQYSEERIRIATGHYARNLDGRLYRGLDRHKDQSYFLYRLSPEQLALADFPLGEYNKKQVWEIAKQLNLPVAQKKDSTGICFIGERPFRTFLQNYFPIKQGLMITPEGEVVGGTSRADVLHDWSAQRFGYWWSE